MITRLETAEQSVRAALAHWESIPRPEAQHLEDRIALGEAMLAADPTNGMIRQALAQLGRRLEGVSTGVDNNAFTGAQATFERADAYYRAVLQEQRIMRGVTNG